MYSVKVEKVTSGGEVMLMDVPVEPAKNGKVIKHELPKTSVNVIVIVHDEPSRVEACIRAIAEQLDSGNSKLTVVDDASKEFTAGLLNKLKKKYKFELLRMRKHYGRLPAMHVAAKRSKSEWIAFVDRGVTVAPGWMDGMLSAITGKAGIVSPWTSRRIPIPHGSNFKNVGRGMSFNSRVLKVALPVPTCFMVRRKMLEACGGLDVARYSPGYGEVADLYMRARAVGWKSVRAPVYVLDGNSNVRAGERFMSKWGDAGINAMTIGNDGVVEVASNMLTGIRHFAGKANLPKLVFCFREYELCGATLAATHICNSMIDIGWDATFAFTKEVPGQSLRKLPMKFAPLKMGSRTELISKLKAGMNEAILVAPTWRSAVDIAEICKDRKKLIPVYYVQDDERRFRRPNGELYAKASDIVNAIKLIKNRVANSLWVQSLVRSMSVACEHIPIGVDTLMFHPDGRSDRVRVMAHCRPSTPRRGWPFVQAVLNRAASKTDFEFVAYDQPYESTEMAVPWHGNIGSVSPAELALQMQTADIFIEGSEYQGFGMQSLEAMACGCALISTSNGGIAEYGMNGVNCRIVKHGDVKGAADVLVKLIGDRNERFKFGVEARTKAKEFDWQLIAKRWDKYLRSIV